MYCIMTCTSMMQYVGGRYGSKSSTPLNFLFDLTLNMTTLLGPTFRKILLTEQTVS